MAVSPASEVRAGRVQSDNRLRYALLVGTTISTIGMAVTLAGILMGPLFLPGVYLIGLGLLVLAVAGIAGAATAPDDAPAAPVRRPGAGPRS